MRKSCWLFVVGGMALSTLNACPAQGQAPRAAEVRRAPQAVARQPAPPATPMAPAEEPPVRAEGDGKPDAKASPAQDHAKPSSSTSSGTQLDSREAERLYRQERRRSWIFRRYAGTIDMQQKVPYPDLYYGQYYQRPWKPDWVHPLPPPPIRYEYGPLGRHADEWQGEFQQPVQQPDQPPQLQQPLGPQDPAPLPAAPEVPGGTAARKPKAQRK